jgi:hypothetical protein
LARRWITSARKRRIVRAFAGAFSVRKKPTDEGAGGGEAGFFDVGFRNGGGFAIAAPAMAARLGEGGNRRWTPGLDASSMLRADSGRRVVPQSHRARLRGFRRTSRVQPDRPAWSRFSIYYDLTGKPMQDRIRDAVLRSLEFELRVTGERRTSFFYPHDSSTAPWWLGENTRLGSLSAAAAGTGRNNPEYVFFSSWEYKSAPGGICNGITSGYKDEPRHRPERSLQSHEPGLRLALGRATDPAA